MGDYVELPRVAAQEGLYSIDRDGSVFVSLPLIDDSYRLEPGYEIVSPPAGSYVTVHREGADLTDAYRALEEYLHKHHLTARTQVVDRQSQTDMHTLLVGI